MLSKLKEISSILEGCRTDGTIMDYCLIGGLAVAARGYPRATADIDFAVRLNDKNRELFCTKLNFSSRDGDVFDPLRTVYFPRNEEESIQLIQFWPKFDSQDLRVIGLTELLLLKFLAGSKKDLHDIEELISVSTLSDEETKRLENLKRLFLSQ
jgi:hypothetical protein